MEWNGTAENYFLLLFIPSLLKAVMPSRSVTGEFLDQLRDCQLLKHCALWS